MTREKRKIAAEEFKEWRDSYYNKNKLPATMFIEEVIKILEQEPCEDAISRNGVIKSIKWWFDIIELNPDILIDSINTMPSVNQTKVESTDAISRQAVIDLIESGISTDTDDDIEYVKGLIKKLPPVNPQEPCDKCEVGNPCLYCKHEFEPQESEDKE